MVKKTENIGIIKEVEGSVVVVYFKNELPKIYSKQMIQIVQI